MNHLLVATQNKGKLKEILRIFGAQIPDLTLHTLDEFPDAEDVEESGDTFEENALIKARAGYALSGMPTLADDSGLVIDALGGRPGIHSARYSGQGVAANIEKVLAEMEGIADPLRTARFVTVAAFVAADEILARGEFEGVITRAPRGEGGFGYDPIFQPVGIDQTLAQLTSAQKDEMSHRGRALRELAPQVAIRFAQMQRPAK